ncbi:MAG: hypothetical protein NZ651_04055 [Candidatus Bipolaricaulota bacterium]|nr:hypothetical protein [Candidatus Bipolaricaulota bacterium]MDW8126925.1 hypothetical protein [Candidatus Bipolaricaulota bacterium]
MSASFTCILPTRTAEFWEALAKVRYQGALVLECFPHPDPEHLFPEAEVRRRVGLR